MISRLRLPGTWKLWLPAAIAVVIAPLLLIAEATQDRVTLRTGQSVSVTIVAYRDSILIVEHDSGERDSHPREALQSLRFEIDREAPENFEPAPRLDPGGVAIYLRDGTVRQERLQRIDDVEVTTAASSYPRDEVYQIVFVPQARQETRGGSDDGPADDAPAECIAELKALADRVDEYGDDWADRLESIDEANADNYRIKADSNTRQLAVEQVERLYEHQHADAMRNVVIVQCIGAYMLITRDWISFDLDFGMEMPFWAQVMDLPLASFAEEQRDLLGRKDADLRGLNLEDIARPPFRDYLDRQAEAARTWNRASDACRGDGLSACLDRAFDDYCATFRQIRGRWTAQTKHRFNQIAAPNYDDVASEWLLRNLVRVLGARDFALRYGKALKLRDITIEIENYEYNEALTLTRGLDQGYSNLLNAIKSGQRGSLSNVPLFLQEQVDWYERLRSKREDRIRQATGSINEGCGESPPIRLLILKRAELERLQREIDRMPPELDASLPAALARYLRERG